MEPHEKMYLIISLIWELENSYQKKEKNIYMNNLRSEIQRTLKIMKILMTDLKTILKMKACIISRITSLVSMKLQHQHVIALTQQNSALNCSHEKKSYNNVVTVATRAFEVVISSSIKGEVE